VKSGKSVVQFLWLRLAALSFSLRFLLFEVALVAALPLCEIRGSLFVRGQPARTV
jgi:hypothetical protein